MVLCDKYYIFVAILISVTIGIIWINLSNLFLSKQSKTYLNLSEDQIKFNAYLTKFNKSYSGEEYVKRLRYFKKSLQDITFLNANNVTGARHGLTKFSDLSQAEFAKLMHNPAYGEECRNWYKECNYNGPYTIFLRSFADFDDRFHPYFVQDAWDWRDHNAVGPVLDQKMCNGCWAFGIVGVMESMEVIQRGRYTQRSIQELLDCSTYNQGCTGGHVTTALNFLCSRNMEIITQEEYPLKLIQGYCNWAPINEYKADGRGVKQFWTRCNMNEKEIISTIYKHGPVMAVVNAAPWQHYTGGIIHRACYRSLDGNSIDHVVQIVGYNLNSEIPYYIIRNSWGEDFGEDGYVKVAIGDNVCGVSDEITYLNVK